MSRRRGLGIAALLGLAAAIGTLVMPVPAQAQGHQCNYCHDVHGATQGPALLNDAIMVDLCLTCHETASPPTAPDGQTIPQNGYDIHNGAKHAEPTGCWDCHGHPAEAGGNLAYINSSMPLPASAGGGTSSVVFTAYSGPNSFGPGDGVPYDGVCEVCHTITDVHKNDGSGGSHDTAVDCRQCHEHSNGFQGEGSCTTCHNTGGLGTSGPNSRRAIIPELGYNTHHISTVADTSAACLTCHYQGDGSHKGGTVKLQDADGGIVALSGDPLTNATAAAEASAVCLSCHDEDRPTNPFGDNLNPPQATTSALWVASSHEGATTLECFSCHGSGHGSQKQGLLRGTGDFTTAANTTTNYEAEEGLCFQCHSSAGAASADIESQFATPINWSASEWGLNQITTFNDRHDVQHEASSVSGATIECVNCHRPHADNSSQKYNPDPDPDNTPPDWTGRSAMDAFCADCHDGTFPAGVQGHIRPVGHADEGQPVAMTDVANTWANVNLPAGATRDGMGAAAGAATNERDYVLVERTAGAGGTNGASDGSGDMDYLLYADAFGVDPVLNCTQCHRPHPKAAAEWPGTYKYDLLSYQDSVRLSDGRAIAYPINIVVGRKGNPNTADAVWDFGLTDDLNPPTVEAAGGFTCNACHARENMNTKTEGCATGGGCHSHGNNL